MLYYSGSRLKKIHSQQEFAAMSAEKEEKQEEKKPEIPKTEVKDALVESKHSITVGGKQLAYTVTTGTMVLKEEGEIKNNFKFREW